MSWSKLAHLVDDVCVYEAGPRPLRVERFPDGTTSLMFRDLGGGRSDLSIVGPRTRAVFKTAPRAEIVIVVQFRPGAALPFVGVSVSELTDRFAALSDLWGRAGTRLHDRLDAGRTSSEKLALLGETLVERVLEIDEPTATRIARRAIGEIAKHAGKLRIDDVAAALGVTPRHLRRAFTEAVGVGPKEFARMTRLRAALRDFAMQRTWTETALAAGYYDQAHFIGDFREIVGMAPSAFKTRGILQRC